MKYVNALLLVIVAAALGANFYQDHVQVTALRARVDSLAAAIPTQHEAEASPFDKVVANPNPMNDPLRAPSGPVTTISYARTEHDFGRIEAGPTYTTTFKFTNTGKEDLLVSEAIGSCGCTVPSWPKEPVKPGQSAEIKVDFDTKGRYGDQLKTVTVTTNTEPSKNVLTIKSHVTVKLK